MGMFLEASDLPDGTGSDVGLTADQMIDDAESLALLAAPCLGDETLDPALTYQQINVVRAILRGAIMRWSDAGSGAKQQQSAGPFMQSIDTTVTRRGMFWPSEITHLQAVCSGGEKGKAYSVDTAPSSGLAGHAPFCSLMFGGSVCSCGFSIAGWPIYEPVD